jgi:hypothetical protein
VNALLTFIVSGAIIAAVAGFVVTVRFANHLRRGF